MKVCSVIFVFIFSLAAKAGIPGLSPIDPTYNQVQGPSYVVENMPPTQSQDSLGVCYAYSAGAFLDAVGCKFDHQDCTQLPDKYSFSRLDLAKYGQDVPKVEEYRSYYNQGLIEGGSPLNVVINMLERDMPAVSEECASLDKTLVHFGDSYEMMKAQSKAWAHLRGSYQSFQKQNKDCPTCAADFAASAVDDIRQNFNLKQSNSEILRAFSEETYEKFLDKMMIPEACHKNTDDWLVLPHIHRMDLEIFPSDLNHFSNYEESLSKIRGALQEKNPVLVNTLCLDQKFDIAQTQKIIKRNINKIIRVRAQGQKEDMRTLTPSCQSRHAVVITGYRKICKKDNPKDCRDSLKIQNSWGQSWQDQNNDGWMDAKVLLDRTSYQPQSFGWIQEKKKSSTTRSTIPSSSKKLSRR